MSPTQDRLTPEERALAERLGELRLPEPPAELDARIRAHAHAAVHRRGFRWQWGMGTAAAALLAAVVLHRALDTPNMSGAPPSMAPDSLPVRNEPQLAPAPESPAPSDDGQSAGDAPTAGSAAPAEVAAEEEAATIMFDRAEPRSAPPADEAALRSTEGPAPRGDAKASRFAEPFPAAPKSSASAPAEQVAPAEPAAPARARTRMDSDTSSTARDAASPSPELHVQPAPVAAESQLRVSPTKPAAQPEDSRRRAAPAKVEPEPAALAPAPLASPAPPPPPAAPAVPARPERPRGASPEPLGRMQEERSVAPSTAAGATGKTEARSGDRSVDTGSDEERLDRIEVTGSRLKRADVEEAPGFTTFDEGIEQVRALLEAGRRDEARALLRQLRQQFPQARVPADLRPLLRDTR